MLFITITPFAIISLGLAIWKLENVLEQRDTRIDAISVALPTISFSSILYTFSSAGTKELSTTMDAVMAGNQELLDAINYTSLVTLVLAVISTIL
ncbi:hypothetical protein CN354_16310 [Bacillus cereus]|nr:hypothetical protein CN354_16310 [Bacillus cereus]